MGWRRAGPADAAALAALEEAANLVALAHVFGDLPFPREAVLEHWRDTLAEADVSVDVVDGVSGEDGGTGGALDCFVAYDATTLRHLAVRPGRWGEGLATAAIARATGAIRAAGHRPRLRCLVENHRALRLYAHLGWTPSGLERRAPWPPYPMERELVLAGSGS